MYTSQLGRVMYCTIAYIGRPARPRGHQSLLTWFDLADKFSIWHGREHGVVMSRMTYLERRFMSRKLRGCRLRVRVGEIRLEMNMENQPCVGDSKPRLPPEYGYRSSTAERKIQAPCLTERAQWVTVVRPLDTASEVVACVASCQEKVLLSQNGPLMVCAIPHWAGPAQAPWCSGVNQMNGWMGGRGWEWRQCCETTGANCKLTRSCGIINMLSLGAAWNILRGWVFLLRLFASFRHWLMRAVCCLQKDGKHWGTSGCVPTYNQVLLH